MVVPVASFKHVGVPAFDPDKLAEFYTRWFGMVITDIGFGVGDGARVVFMSADPAEHHQIAFSNQRQPGSPGMQQLSFVFETLEELQHLAKAFDRENVPILQQKDHGNTWSIYVADPEGNRVECYTPSPWYVPQPVWWPLDLVNETVEEIFERTRQKVEATPGHTTRAEWMEKIRQQVEAARQKHWQAAEA